MIFRPVLARAVQSLVIVSAASTSTIAAAQPDIDCPPDSILEGEPICYDGYEDVYNPGCNTDPPIFQDIECNTTICGTSGTFDFFDGETQIKHRDMDWFSFTSEFVVDLSWEVVAEYPVAVWLIDAKSGDCTDHVTLDFINGEAGQVCKVGSGIYPPGEYWLIQAPSNWEDHPCGLEWYGSFYCDCVHPCELECEYGATSEGEEQCHTGYIDVTNGGCAADTFAEGSISLGETVCGYTGIFEDELRGSVFDDDWYSFTSSSEKVEFNLKAELKVAAYIIKAGDGAEPCEGTEIVAEDVAESCETLRLTATLMAGEDYWFVVRPDDPGLLPYPCDTLYNCTLTDLSDPDCPADVTGSDGNPDGAVDVLDLLDILAKWGTGDPSADISGPDGEPDGIVDVIDLLAVLGAWGPC